MLRCEIGTGVGGFCLRSVRAGGGGCSLRSASRGGCCSRSAPGGATVRDQCWGAAMRDWQMGGEEWCCERKRDIERKQERGGGVRGYNILKKGLRIFFF